MRTISEIEEERQLLQNLLTEIAQELNWDGLERALLALEGTLHLLRDLLDIEEAIAVGTELSLILRGIYYDGYTPDKKFRRLEITTFPETAAVYFRNDPQVESESAIRVVLNALQRKIEEGKISDFRNRIPERIKKLFNL